MHRFDGKVAFVTGAAAGLGRAVAERLAHEGATVVVADLDRAGASALAAALPEALPLQVNTADAGAVDDAFREATARCGRIDVIVNNAGISTDPTPLHETDDRSWRRVMSVNADGAFHVLRRGINVMLESGGGAIVNMASSTGLSGKPGLTPYTFSKAGLIGLTRAAAVEYAARGIRVNAVAPTAVMTSLVERHIAGAADPEAMRRVVESQTPMPGLPLPGDVAAAVAFLASDDARWITGHTLPVDGGFHAA